MLILVAAHCRIDRLYELFATYWSRGLYYPRLIFSISWFSYMHALILTFNRKTVDSSVIWTRTLLGTVSPSISWVIRQYKPRLHYNVLGTAFAAVLLFLGTARHGTARLHLSFCRAGLKIGIGPSTGAILTAHTDLFHCAARLSVYTCVKAGTAYFVVRGKAKNLGTGTEPAQFTLSEFAVPCGKKAAPVPKY